MAQEVEDLLKRLGNQKGVVGIITINGEGIPIKSTIEETLTVQYTALMSQLVFKAREVVQDMDKNNDLGHIRIHSKKHEFVLIPDREFILIVIQDPTD